MDKETINKKEVRKNDLKTRIYKWVLGLISYVNTLPKDMTTEVLVKQLLRSGTSIGANYTEAQAGSSRKDFANFVSHSLKSANESKFWLALLKDTRKKDAAIITELLNELTELSNILGASLVTLKKGNVNKDNKTT